MPNISSGYHAGFLMHHGVKGQKHGIRNYQYEDGKYTPLGREHYGIGPPRGSGVETGAEKIARKYKAAKESFKAYRTKKKRQLALARVRKAKEAKKAEEERIASEKREQEERIERSKRDKREYEADTERLKAESAKEMAEIDARRAIEARQKEADELSNKESLLQKAAIVRSRDERYADYTNEDLQAILDRKRLENDILEEDRKKEATDAARADIKKQNIDRGKEYLKTAYEMANIGFQSYQLLNAYKAAKAATKDAAKDGNTASFNVNIQNKQTTTTKNGQTTQTKNGQPVQQQNQNNQNNNQQKQNNSLSLNAQQQEQLAAAATQFMTVGSAAIEALLNSKKK